jgi:hypothetical protein
MTAQLPCPVLVTATRCDEPSAGLACRLHRDLGHCLGWPVRVEWSADLVGEPVAGGLPGDTKRDRDLIPAPAARPGRRDSLGNQSLIPTDLVGRLGNGTQVREILCRRGSRIQSRRQPLETAGRLLDLRIRVLRWVTSA